MSRQDSNQAFALTSFLNGVNASYIEEMQAQYERNPGSVSDQWRLFFQSLQEEQAGAGHGAENGNGGPSWGKTFDELQAPTSSASGELVAALTSDFGATERDVRDKINQRAQTYG
jgi:2-oxoglutarate dehydrogenase E1 component